MGAAQLPQPDLAAPGQSVPAAKLAEFYGLPAAYLIKQLQALARAGIVLSTSGPRGGFMLTRSPERITLLDVVVAIEGPDEAFRCQQLLKRGPALILPPTTGRPVSSRRQCGGPTRRGAGSWPARRWPT